MDIQHKRTISFTGKKASQTVEISGAALESGFFNQLPGNTLIIYLYLLTHQEQENTAVVEKTQLLASLNLDQTEFSKAIDYLEKRGFLSTGHFGSKEHYLEFTLYPEILKKTTQSNSQKREPEKSSRELRQQVMRAVNTSQEELATALLSFVPANSRNSSLREDIMNWLRDFEARMLQELIRRVDKWQERQGMTSGSPGAFSYLKAIISSWYEEDILTYQDLQEQDKLHRETKELAKTYGIRGGNLSNAQLKTFQSWITGDLALGQELALFAIREAVRRKKDGQPSLKYIEDNFIKPWQEAGIKTVTEAYSWLKKSRQSSPAKQTKNSDKQQGEKAGGKSVNYKWQDFYWDYDDFKES